MSYLVLYLDGGNGLRRGGVCHDLPSHVKQVERNQGEKIYESEDGQTWFVALLGQKEPVYSEDRHSDTVVPITFKECRVENSDNRSYGELSVEATTPLGVLTVSARVSRGDLVDAEWELDGGELAVEHPDLDLPTLDFAECLGLEDPQWVERVRECLVEWVLDQG